MQYKRRTKIKINEFIAIDDDGNEYKIFELRNVIRTFRNARLLKERLGLIEFATSDKQEVLLKDGNFYLNNIKLKVKE